MTENLPAVVHPYHEAFDEPPFEQPEYARDEARATGGEVVIHEHQTNANIRMDFNHTVPYGSKQ